MWTLRSAVYVPQPLLLHVSSHTTAETVGLESARGVRSAVAPSLIGAGWIQSESATIVQKMINYFSSLAHIPHLFQFAFASSLTQVFKVY